MLVLLRSAATRQSNCVISKLIQQLQNDYVCQRERYGGVASISDSVGGILEGSLCLFSAG